MVDPHLCRLRDTAAARFYRYHIFQRPLDRFRFFHHPPAVGEEERLRFTTLPCIFIHVVCQFNSIALALQSSVSWRVVQFP